MTREWFILELMPVSDYHQISDVLHIVQQLAPSRILDIGVGFGKWGMLCREVLDVGEGRIPKKSWKTVIDGIEVFENYRNELWSFAYNEVHVTDATQVLSKLKPYDLILCCDVIEHFEKADGFNFLQQMLAHSKVVIITSPRGFRAQDPVYGNDHEEHKSGWDQEDFVTFPHLYKPVGFTFMAVIANDANHLKGIKIRHPLDVLGVKKGAKAWLEMVADKVATKAGLKKTGT